MNIGERIGMLMRAQGLSQKELAGVIGVTEAAMSRYLNNDREPKIEVVAKLAKVLHTTTDYLICGDVQGTAFDEVYGMVARNADRLSEKESLAIIRVLMKKWDHLVERR